MLRALDYQFTPTEPVPAFVFCGACAERELGTISSPADRASVGLRKRLPNSRERSAKRQREKNPRMRLNTSESFHQALCSEATIGFPGKAIFDMSIT